ncbi:MAG: hypothetical protein CVT73_13810 [Alphaproteobacteria bacterium HGW-Alphaproteobacteria-12]|nr:MAG: hypothetical protein CVT73_13810 [Alphaproteobacteria bacterium HGW-Alphaproteobacteria-12]
MRDLVKTMTYASLHFTVGFAVTYALTGQLAIAAGVALIEPSVNTVVFFLHEKVWAHYPATAIDIFGHGHGAGPVPAA